MSAFGEKLDKKKFASIDVPFVLDGDAAMRRDHAMQALVLASQKLDAARKGKNPDARLTASATRTAQKEYDAVAADVAAIEEEMRDSVVTLRITAVDFSDYNLYQTKNPPRRGKTEYFNPLSFYLYVARRSAVYVDDEGETHRIEEHEWVKFEKKLTDGEHEKLANAITDVNRGQGLQDLGFLSISSPRTPSSSETSEPPEPKE